ncbi:phosphotransferase [Brachybacterium kimchii]|uniref:Aminoglycoside phosphotransferase family protein n=1 Tax=Brachybacterium kimchii TaxID=2942909 RepID=A0ABY4N433_9MICO|nr:phosphotransferase [Brachybacterium kimchii]UQN28208.1 aminoglycoside phosphotransferase family protein [Brachybacterium kimchii]
MDPSRLSRAITAALEVARAQGLDAHEARVLSNSNKAVLLLLPSAVVARVGPADQPIAAFELDLAVRLADAGAPVVAPDPRVAPAARLRDGFEVSLWSWVDPSGSPDRAPTAPAALAEALAHLHAAMRSVDVPAPRFTDRVRSALELLDDRERSPRLRTQDRDLLRGTLVELRDAVGSTGREQLLHGEPHPGNILDSPRGPVFIDLETCCRGPVEFDLAHLRPEGAEHYRSAASTDHGGPAHPDATLLAQCRRLTLALATTWRFDVEDAFPDGARVGEEWLAELRRTDGFAHSG